MLARQAVKREHRSGKGAAVGLVYSLINEGAKILDEGIAIRGSDIDVVWVNGYGWPVYRGGPMFYANLVGLKTVADKMKELSARFPQDLRYGIPFGPRMRSDLVVAAFIERFALEELHRQKRDAPVLAHVDYLELVTAF